MKRAICPIDKRTWLSHTEARLIKGKFEHIYYCGNCNKYFPKKKCIIK